jgi:hypothetical protein
MGLIPSGITGIFRHNPSGRTTVMGLTQPLTETSKGGRCVGLTLPPSCADCLEICEPQPPGTLRAYNGIALKYLKTLGSSLRDIAKG